MSPISTSVATPASPSSVLVVDDDAGVRDVCVRALRINGYKVGAAENGRVALERLKENSYDLILTDLQMPEMGGLRLLQELRQLANDIDVIVFTAYGTFESAREALRLGAVDYLTKPLELEDLERTVRRALAWRQVRSEKQRLSEIVALYEISQTFTGTLDTATAVREIVQLLWRRFTPRSLSLSLLHPEDGQLELLAQRGEARDTSPGTRLAVGGRTEQLIEQAHLALVGETNVPNPGHLVSLVLRTNDRPVGILRLTRGAEQPGFGGDDRTMLAVCASQIAASLDNSRLYQQLKDQNLQTIAALAAAIEARDPHTRGHSEQVMYYAVRLGELANLQPQRIEHIRYGALLHDIGKIGIRDYILLKPGPLTEDELEVMRQHPRIGAEILQQIKSLRDVIPIIECHHERMDGHGYPNGRNGIDLSEEARILAIADAYDAMTSDRAYRKAMQPGQAFQILRDGRGTHWDGEFVELFIGMIEREGSNLLIPVRPAQLVVQGPLDRPMLVPVDLRD